MLGLLIDGARMVSPGLLRSALDACAIDPTKVVGTLAFHLGPDAQMRSVNAGYNQKVEDELLASIPWREDGYRLFDIAVLAGSSRQGWFGNIAESNAVFFSRKVWERLGGLDERFAAPGGGYANLDFWKRAVSASSNQPWMILGEGTFHQIHGGAATNGSGDDRQRMHDEYEDISGERFKVPIYRPRFIGVLEKNLARRFMGDVLTPPRKAPSVKGRSFAVGIAPDSLDSIQAGTLKTRYKGRRFAKNPFDISLYLKLIESLKPKTIVEIGTSEGGSALWFRDQCKSIGISCTIVTMDIQSPARPIDDVLFFAQIQHGRWKLFRIKYLLQQRIIGLQ